MVPRNSPIVSAKREPIYRKRGIDLTCSCWEGGGGGGYFLESSCSGLTRSTEVTCRIVSSKHRSRRSMILQGAHWGRPFTCCSSGSTRRYLHRQSERAASLLHGEITRVQYLSMVIMRGSLCDARETIITGVLY